LSLKMKYIFPVPKGLHLTSHTFEDETHMSVVPAMMSRTLMVLYSIKREWAHQTTKYIAH